MNGLENVILFQIDKTSKISKIYSQREFDRLGIDITVDQWVLLKIIHEHPEISQKELADKSLRDPASITRTVDLLEKKELVMRQSIPNNRRQYQILLTEYGMKFISEHMPMVMKHRSRSMEGFSSDEAQLLATFLKRIQNNML